MNAVSAWLFGAARYRCARHQAEPPRGEPCAFLDLSALKPEFLRTIPIFMSVVWLTGLNHRELIPVVPAAHLHVAAFTLTWWPHQRATLNAIGETACTGLHGAIDGQHVVARMPDKRKICRGADAAEIATGIWLLLAALGKSDARGGSGARGSGHAADPTYVWNYAGVSVLSRLTRARVFYWSCVRRSKFLSGCD